jgi:hypothetical protein
MANEYNVGKLSTDGMFVGRSAAELVGYWGTTPVAQPSATAQSTVATAALTNAATVAPIVSGYSFSTTAEFTAMISTINALNTRVAALTTLVVEFRRSLVLTGQIKGSA